MIYCIHQLVKISKKRVLLRKKLRYISTEKSIGPVRFLLILISNLMRNLIFLYMYQVAK
jgi:hypothetical protein